MVGDLPHSALYAPCTVSLTEPADSMEVTRIFSLGGRRGPRWPQRSSRFVVVSGLPGSGKTTLARKLAPALSLPVVDKDQILDRLFESKGVGDAMWRRALSRESDLILEREGHVFRWSHSRVILGGAGNDS